MFDDEVRDSFVESIGVHMCAVVELYGDESIELSREPSYRKESWTSLFSVENMGP